MSEDRRARIERQITEILGAPATNNGESREARATRISIRGGGNVFARHVTINNGASPASSANQHISYDHAERIRQLIDEAAQIEHEGGRGAKETLAKKWWRKLLDRYDVSTYLFLPASSGLPAIAWLEREIASLSPRRSWRAEICAAIRERAGELRMDGAQLLSLAQKQTGRSIIKIESLDPRELGKLYSSMLAMRRPALE